ncbi:MAG: ABC transporter ATP-binding protein [Desulfobacterales bacterium]|nr:ABC transporter ATP-binding protein [Desulfobacterales bacterium]
MSLLEIQNLTKSFGGLKAVDNFSLKIASGEIVGLIGPNGAGKTTIFNLITGAIRADSGRVDLDGQSLTRFKPWDICRAGIGRTFQVVRPFMNRTVLYNAMVGAFARVKTPEEAEARALETLAFTGLLPKKDVLAKSLTLPDRKRLEITRALATRPRLLLLDEVMAGLNETETQEAIELVQRLRREMDVSLLIIEHVMEVVMTLSDRIVVLHHGEKICEGPPESVCSDQCVIEAYLGDDYGAACN